MADILTHPTIFGDLRMMQLHISGASFITIGDAPSIPNCVVLSNRGRRWELIISDAYETDKAGKRLGPGPASTPPAMPGATEKETVLENRIILLKAQLAAERQEREGLYPVIDEMKRVRELLEKTIADREAAIKAFEKENAKLRLQETQNQAEICEACRKAAEDTENGVPLPPDPAEDARLDAIASTGIAPPDQPICQMVDGRCPQGCDFYGANDVPSGYPCSTKAPPEPDEDKIREAREARDERQERQHDAARQHAAEGG